MAIIDREIALDIVAGGNYQLYELEHVAGATNVVADALSRVWALHPVKRFAMSEGFAMGPRAEEKPEVAEQLTPAQGHTLEDQ